MDGLLSTVESIGLRVGGLTAGLLVADKLNLDEMILGGSAGGSVEEAVRMTGYITAVEYITDMASEKILGYRPPSLHKDIGVQFLTSFATNTAVYYVMNQADVVEMINEKFSGSDVQVALAHSIVYALTNEISYRLISMWFNPADPAKYGNKYQP